MVSDTTEDCNIVQFDTTTSQLPSREELAEFDQSVGYLEHHDVGFRGNVSQGVVVFFDTNSIMIYKIQR